MPIAGALVYCEPCGEITHTWATADANGSYSFSGDLANGGGIWLSAGKRTSGSARADGYCDPSGLLGRREVLIIGDTRLDFQLVRRRPGTSDIHVWSSRLSPHLPRLRALRTSGHSECTLTRACSLQATKNLRKVSLWLGLAGRGSA